MTVDDLNIHTIRIQDTGYNPGNRSMMESPSQWVVSHDDVKNASAFLAKARSPKNKALLLIC